MLRTACRESRRGKQWLGRGADSKFGEKCLDSGYIFNREAIGFADRWGVRYNRK